MKKFLLVMIVAFVSHSGFSQFSKASLQASGLTCAMCSKAVKVALEKVDFVKEVKVNIKKQEYTVVFKEDSHTDFDALKKSGRGCRFFCCFLKNNRKFQQREC